MFWTQNIKMMIFHVFVVKTFKTILISANFCSQKIIYFSVWKVKTQICEMWNTFLTVNCDPRSSASRFEWLANHCIQQSFSKMGTFDFLEQNKILIIYKLNILYLWHGHSITSQAKKKLAGTQKDRKKNVETALPGLRTTTGHYGSGAQWWYGCQRTIILRYYKKKRYSHA